MKLGQIIQTTHIPMTKAIINMTQGIMTGTFETGHWSANIFQNYENSKNDYRALYSKYSYFLGIKDRMLMSSVTLLMIFILQIQHVLSLAQEVI